MDYFVFTRALLSIFTCIMSVVPLLTLVVLYKIYKQLKIKDIDKDD